MFYKRYRKILPGLIVRKQGLLLAALALILFVPACKMPSSAVYQKTISFKNGYWDSEKPADFKIKIEDTAAVYQLYLLLRHDDNFPFSNIWIRMSVKSPSDSEFVHGERINLKLADVDGSWLGKGMGSIWEHKIPIGKKLSPQFKKPGVYEISLTHIMRNDPLEGVLNAGIVLEKRK